MKPSSTNPNLVRDLVAAAVLVTAVALAYHNSLGGPFLFDDALAIVENPTIRDLGSWRVLQPPGQGVTVQGRPLLNLSFALNYALSGTAAGGYHVTNLLIHVVAALALMGIVRRTLELPRFAVAWRERARGLGLAVALVWALHPVQTESVTYVVQRAESLMGACVLLTLYAFVRGARPGGDRRWLLAAVAGAWLGAAAKEVAAVAPVFALLYDRTFMAGSFRAAWMARRRAHLGLMASWLLTAALVFGSGSRGGTVGFGSNVAWHDYALTQFDALARYAGLVLWPQPLVFDYGTAWVASAAAVWPQILLVFTLIAGTLVALRRWPVAGFLGACFLGPLAPTSLVPGNRQTMTEHRVYLPLAAVAVASVAGAGVALQRRETATRIVAAALVSGAFGLLTIRRNDDYRSALTLYRDTVAKRPDNAFARYNLGKVLAESGQPVAAVEEYRAALRLRPEMFLVHDNLGNALRALGRRDEAEAAYRDVLRVVPGHVLASFNLANLLIEQQRKEEALTFYATAVAGAPEFVEARLNLGGVLLDLGRLDEARGEFERVLAADPKSAAAHTNLGHVFYLRKRPAEARREYEAALRLQPGFAPARAGLERVDAAR